MKSAGKNSADFAFIFRKVARNLRKCRRRRRALGGRLFEWCMDMPGENARRVGLL